MPSPGAVPHARGPAAKLGFGPAVWVGGAALAWSGVLQAVFPRAMGTLPPGFRTPILAFELARSPPEVEAIFGPPGSADRATWVAAMDLGNRLDFAFMPLYAGFLALLALALGGEKRQMTYVAVGLAGVAALADLAENLCLFDITGHLGGDYGGSLGWLLPFTWIKWGNIAACMACLGPELQKGGVVGKVAAAVIALTALVTPLAAVFRGGLAEAMLLGITLAFVAAWVDAINRRRAAAGDGAA